MMMAQPTPASMQYATGSSSLVQDNFNVFQMVSQMSSHNNSEETLLSKLKISTPCDSQSGKLDSDYIPCSNINKTPVIQVIDSIRHPAQLTGVIQSTQVLCDIGYFSLIGYNWLIVDNRLFLWGLIEKGQKVICFDELQHTIISVHLVEFNIPSVLKKNTPNLTHLLVAVTASEIAVIGANLENSNLSLTSVLHRVPCDGIILHDVVSTKSARVFMAGKDGNLYELLHNSDPGWFSNVFQKNCLTGNWISGLFSFWSAADAIKQMVIDDARNLLWCRTSNHGLKLFYLGKDGMSFQYVSSLDISGLIHQATRRFPTIDQSVFSELAVINLTDHNGIHLVAVTSVGVRIYFSSSSMSYGNQCDTPNCIRLVHIRLPPGFSPSIVTRPSACCLAVVNSEETLLVCSSSASNLQGSPSPDLIWLLSTRNCSRQNQNVVETFSSGTQIFGEKAIAILPLDSFKSLAVASNSFAGTANPGLIDFRAKKLRYLVYTLSAAHTIETQTPLDALRHILLRVPSAKHGMVAGSGDSAMKSLENFVTEFGNLDACFMSLAMSVDPHASEDLIGKAVFLVANLGSLIEIHFESLQNPQSMGAGDHHPSTSLYTGQSFYQGQAPMQMMSGANHQPMTGQTSYLGKLTSNGQTNNQLTSSISHQDSDKWHSSTRCRAIVVSLSRVLNQVWTKKLFSGDSDQLRSTIASVRDTLELLCRAVKRVIALLPDFALQASLTSSSNISRPANQPNLEHVLEASLKRAAQIEVDMLQQALSLCESARQRLSLACLVHDHGVQAVLSSLTNNQSSNLTSLDLSAWLRSQDPCPGSTSQVIINALIRVYQTAGLSVDPLCRSLELLCPQLYSATHRVYVSAMQLLTCNKGRPDVCDIAEAVRLFKSIASDNLDLKIVSRHLVSVGAADSVLDLCLAAAAQRDPVNLAASRYQMRKRNGANKTDLGMTNMTQDFSYFDHSSHQAANKQDDAERAFSDRLEAYAPIWLLLDGFLDGPTQNTSGEGNLLSVSQRSTNNDSMNGSGGIGHSDEHQHQRLLSILHSCAEMQGAVEDMVFQFQLYDWLVFRGFSDYLSDTDTFAWPYVVAYLERQCELNSSQTNGAGTGRNAPEAPKIFTELLAKVLVNRGDTLAAAKILYELAENDRTGCIDLNERIAFLFRAVLHAKAVPKNDVTVSSDVLGRFSMTLEEKVEVAQLQKSILVGLTERQNEWTSKTWFTASLRAKLAGTIRRLNYSLLPLQNLYDDIVCDPDFNLVEFKVAVLHCAGNNDPETLSAVWAEVIQSIFAEASSASSLANKLVSVGAEYAATPGFLVLPSFISRLLYHAVGNPSVTVTIAQPIDWICSILRRLSLTADAILKGIHELILSQSPVNPTTLDAMLLACAVVKCVLDKSSTPFRVVSTDLMRLERDRMLGYRFELDQCDDDAGFEEKKRKAGLELRSVTAKLASS